MTSSYLWHLVKQKSEIARLEHQFQPFHQDIFGVSRRTFEEGNFNGTIFRFPFRTNDMESDVSSTKYDREKMSDLIRSLEADSHSMLLFLKNLESIEVYERSNECVTKLLDVRIAESYRLAVNRQRQAFQKEIRKRIDWTKKTSVSMAYPICLEVTRNDDVSNKETTHWIISQYYAGNDDSAHIRVDKDLGYLPSVGVALKLELTAPDAKDPPCLTEPRGHVFCFLPLPLERKSPTGLRVHVHGSFAIDQNRRHIKLPTPIRIKSEIRL